MARDRSRSGRARRHGKWLFAANYTGGGITITTALTAGTHSHVALDEEGESAEHALLGQAGLGLHECANPVGELDVVGHLQSVSRTRTPRAGNPTRRRGRQPGAEGRPWPCPSATASNARPSDRHGVRMKNWRTCP